MSDSTEEVNQQTLLSSKNVPIQPNKDTLKLTKGVTVGEEEVIDNTGDVPKKVTKVKGLTLSPNFFTDEEKEILEKLFLKLSDSGNLQVIICGYFSKTDNNFYFKQFKTEEETFYSNWIEKNPSLVYKDIPTGNLYTYHVEKGYLRLLTKEDLDSIVDILNNYKEEISSINKKLNVYLASKVVSSMASIDQLSELTSMLNNEIENNKTRISEIKNSQ